MVSKLYQSYGCFLIVKVWCSPHLEWGWEWCSSRPGRMEELGCWHQKEHVKYINKCRMKEHLFVLSCINANGRCNPNFYIFKGKQFWRNYTKGCETRLSKRMQPSAWVMAFLCDKWLEHFIACVKQIWKHVFWEPTLLIMNGHASHIIVDVVNKAKKIGFDIMTLPSHTQHALQPLNVSCFKRF